jgi:hypothetical protein
MERFSRSASLAGSQRWTCALFQHPTRSSTFAGSAGWVFRDMDATWEPLTDFVKHYPEFQLEDELLVEEGRDVMWGIPYKHRETN